jgi:cell surface protein SprA
VRFLYAGVRNVSNPAPQSGEVWINDIYSGDVLRDYDHAERMSANVSLAGGALSVGGNWARTGADYRGLRQKRGAGADNTTLSLNARTDVQYFLPLAGFSLPVSVGYSRNKSLPKYPPNSDTEIVDAAMSDGLLWSLSRNFNTSLSRRNTSSKFLMHYVRRVAAFLQQTLDRPSSRDTTTTMTGAVTYSLNWTSGRNAAAPGRTASAGGRLAGVLVEQARQAGRAGATAAASSAESYILSDS